jgi:hypothetical protein
VDDAPARAKLIAILRSAYSGELGAGLAYRGHAASLRKPHERAELERIEAEEWVHRAEVGRLLAALGAKPQRVREVMMAIVGTGIGIACRVGGWFIPMYFAGRLEHSNVDEYAVGARYARDMGLADHERSLAVMAAVEHEHEAFFLDAVAGHPQLPLFKRFFRWG